MPAGVLNGISPVLDSHKFIDGIEFRKAIYIFITNTGGDMIANRLSELTSQGLNREEIQLYHFEHLIRSGAYNEKGMNLKLRLNKAFIYNLLIFRWIAEFRFDIK